MARSETVAKLDPITFEVISHRISSINDEGSTTIVHASGSPVVHALDYQFGIGGQIVDMACS